MTNYKHWYASEARCKSAHEKGHTKKFDPEGLRNTRFVGIGMIFDAYLHNLFFLSLYTDRYEQ